jgi:hypothetical protein
MPRPGQSPLCRKLKRGTDAKIFDHRSTAMAAVPSLFIDFRRAKRSLDKIAQ